MTTPRVRHVVGCMTGTSLDGLDCALARLTGAGLDMTAEFVGMVSRPFDDGFRAMLGHLAEGNPAPPIEFMRAARTLGVLHADAVAALLNAHPIPDPRSPNPDFVVAHGQTIWHAPQDTLSWQLFDPWPLVRHLGVPVCHDLRQADLIAGGQGAPITPIADWVMYRSDDPVRVVLNLGGIANATVLYDDPSLTSGQDLCPCNLLIDQTVQRLFPGERYDKDGAFSVLGFEGSWFESLLQQPYMQVNTHAVSLGRENLTNDWVDQIRRECPPDDFEPMVAVGTAIYGVASRIAEWLKSQMPYRVVAAGGGARNPNLLAHLRALGDLGANLILSDDLGIPCEAREAMGFAVLGALSQDGVPITLPNVTGSKNPGVAGAWVYP